MEENNIYDRIQEQCKDQFEFSEKLNKYVEQTLLPLLNDSVIEKDNGEETNVIDQAITLLMGQGIRLFKSSAILVREGYSTCALTILRSLVEIIFNIDYIKANDNLKYKRAKEYLEDKSSKKVWRKASKGLNKGLYEAYEILCKYSHVNIVATANNVNDRMLYIGANDTLCNPTVVFINSVYYYFIDTICNYYGIEKENKFNEDIPKEIKVLFDSFTAEKIVFEVFSNIISSIGVDKNYLLEDYAKYKENLKNTKESKKTKRKNKRKKK